MSKAFQPISILLQDIDAETVWPALVWFVGEACGLCTDASWSFDTQ